MHKLLVILLSIIITVLQINIFSFSSFEEYLLAVTLADALNSLSKVGLTHTKTLAS